MSELFLVRHAQASYGTGDYDRLSETGHQQSRWLGEYFRYRGLRFDRVVCGEMVRHQETLEGIAAGMGETFNERRVLAQWNEFDFDALINAYLADRPEEQPDADAPASDFSRLLRKTLLAWADDALAGDIQERFSAFAERIGTALSKATAGAVRGSRVLVVSSGGPISMALSQVLMAPPASMIQLNIQIRNSSYSQLFFNQESMRLAGFNHVPHLDPPGRSHAVTYY